MLSLLAVHTFVSWFQGGSTGRLKFHQKSMTNILRDHQELQSLPSNQPDMLVSQKQGQISHSFYSFVALFCNVLIKEYIYMRLYKLTILCILYAAQDYSSSLSAVQASQKVGHPQSRACLKKKSLVEAKGTKLHLTFQKQLTGYITYPFTTSSTSL